MSDDQDDAPAGDDTPAGEPVDHTSDDLEIIAVFGVLPDAEPCRTALLAAGFDVFLLDENAISVDPALWPMLKGVKVAVPHSQVEEAREFLAAADRGELSQQSPETAIQCPSCGSSNVKFVSNTADRLAFGLAVGGVLAAGGALSPHFETHYLCNNCGAKA